MTTMGTESIFTTCVEFLAQIGIHVQRVSGITGFLDNVKIEQGIIIVDPIDAAVCGSMLHEAGHIAVVPSMFRHLITGDASESITDAMGKYLDNGENHFDYPENPIARGILQSGECEAIAWSYAAARAIGIDTTLPFRLGFEGNGLEVHTGLRMGHHFGINGLAAGGMTDLRGGSAFPKMHKWMQV